MKAYLARVNGDILDLAIRASDEARARGLLDEGDAELALLRPDVAEAMGIPGGEGVHRGVVWRWIAGPTNLLGEGEL